MVHSTQKTLFLIIIALSVQTQVLFNTSTAYSFSNLFTTEFQEPLKPSSIAELQEIVHQAQYKKKKIALVGAGKSMGGQTVPPTVSDYRVSLVQLNKVLNLNIREKIVTVQAGMTWRQLQQYIVPHGLSIKAMQSYHDFSIGGSLAVNIHGQALKYAPIIGTVISCTLLQADGSLITLSRKENYELFQLVIGGYGLFGIIVEVTLSLTDDILLERKSILIETKDLSDYFLQNINNNPDIEFYSARFLLTKEDLLKKAFVITYEKTDKGCLQDFALTQKPKSVIQKILLTMTANSSVIKYIRFMIEKFYLNQPEILSRNNFTSHTIESLPTNKTYSHYILQEYFIPYPQLNSFIESLRTAITMHSINMINITARHVHKDTESKLSFSHEDCCALVLYINISRQEKEYASTITWTRELIDAASACGGSYYLPYQLLATQEQLEKAYPKIKSVFALKKVYDPQEIFVNQLYLQYGHTT